MKFEEALHIIKENTGAGMRLPHWSPEVVVRVQPAQVTPVIMSPYLIVESRFGRVPWRETFPEMFDNSWEVIKC